MGGKVAEEFQNIKQKLQYRYILFKIEDTKTIVVDFVAPRDETWDQFTERLGSEPRYGLYDAEYLADDGGRQTQLIFIMYSPDTCGIKDKMLYASSKDALKLALGGVAKERQIYDDSDKDFEQVVELCKSF